MSSTQNPPTVIAQKQAFLATQTRLLSQPIRPSPAWLSANEASDSPLPDPVIEHVLARLNAALVQHSRRAYPHQASRHVAEQIDALYLSHPAAAAVRGDDDESPDGGLSLSLDLTEDEVLSILPQTWPSETDQTTHPMESRRYAEQSERLRSLAEQRRRARDRVERLRRVKNLLDPFRSADDSGSGSDSAASSSDPNSNSNSGNGNGNGNGVQENLVTRDGQVERELEKMRALLARVGGRVSLLPESTRPLSSTTTTTSSSSSSSSSASGRMGRRRSLSREGDSLIVEPVATGEKRKLDDLLGSF